MPGELEGLRISLVSELNTVQLLQDELEEAQERSRKAEEDFFALLLTTEPEADDIGRPPIITFTKTYSGKTYHYSAIGIYTGEDDESWGLCWYTTAQKDSEKVFTDWSGLAKMMGRFAPTMRLLQGKMST